MGTSTARIYRTIYIVIYGPVREMSNLGLDVTFFFFFTSFFLYTNSETSDTSLLPRACSCFVLLFSDTLLLVATYAILCFSFFVY